MGKQVLNKTAKYQVAKEMDICEKIVYYYTKDIFCKNPRITEINGKEVLFNYPDKRWKCAFD